MSIRFASQLLAVLTFASEAHAAGPERIEFNRDIRPILSDNCFACHGIDAKHRKADLRLDVAESALTAIDGAFPIKPKAHAESTVWQRIISSDADELMPPPDSHKKLSAAQKDLIKRWIEQGAPYQKHWAFEPAVKAPGATSIDGWIDARLAKDGLQPKPEADRPTLIRRVAFALTGLPPTLAEVDAFLADKSPQAYESMVERYLKSPHYGEEMARHWLDVARYADTHGLHLDNERVMWPYRDWVVRAFNDNLPFDQFTTWQLAGDLLPNATPDQITATGFSRCNVTTSEGGAIDDEYRHLYAIDRAATLTQAWLGITGGCAQCHDHKFDPLSQKEFYSLYAFFYSAADPPMDGNIAHTPPIYKLPSAPQQSALAAAQKAESSARAKLDALANQAAASSPAPAKTVLQLFDDTLPLGSSQSNTTRNPSVWQHQPAQGTKSGSRVLRQRNGQFTEENITFAMRGLTAPPQGQLSLWVWLDPLSPPSAVAVIMNGQRQFWGAADAMDNPMFGGASKSTHRGPLMKAGQWQSIVIDLADFGLKPGAALSGLTLQEVGGIVAWDKAEVLGSALPAEAPSLSFESWWQSFATAPAKPAAKAKPRYKANAPAFPDLPGDLVDVLKAGPEADKLDAAKVARLRSFYHAHLSQATTPELAQARTAFLAAKATREAAEAAVPSTFVFADMAKPMDTFIALRGQYTKHGDKVEPAVPAAFAPALETAAGARASRLDLARWLTSPRNPLPARVTVNRLWQQFFGIGLVKTSHDFGSQGEPPSHPELLDWLALSFRDSGWDTRALVKQMLLSKAFRRAATMTPAEVERDTENRLLARGPRFRLDAEQIRDNALFVSGLIDLSMGGRGALSYQPPNIWEPVGYENSNTRYYLQEHGAQLYRRSLYSFLKRTAPPPFMSNFDAPNREQSCTRRERTNTPLQALQLMNDTQHFEAARALAQRVLAAPETQDTARLQHLFRLVLAREPQAQELAVLTRALAAQRQLYQANPQAAAQAIQVGESKPNTTAKPTDLAAWSLVANLVLNLDEAVTRN